MLKKLKKLYDKPYNYGTSFGRFPFMLKKEGETWVQMESWQSRLMATVVWSFTSCCAVYVGWNARKNWEEIQEMKNDPEFDSNEFWEEVKDLTNAFIK